MNYPLISEYIEAIKSAEDNFEELSYLRPVLGDDGLPVMTSGNFAVVFKMKDEQSGKFYAVKCFTKEQEGRAEAYREIAKELEKVSSPYIVSIRYLDKELFVDTDQTTETEFPVLLMDWAEGKTLDKYLHENLDDKYALEMLAYRFSQLAQWLIPQPFAHGDLKPDNILVREDGTLVLVDYDGMYVPAMKGQKARELGSPDFRHPQRTEDDFDDHIDDFPLVSILLSLHTISKDPQLLEGYGAADRLLFSKEDYLNIDCHPIINQLLVYNDSNINVLISIFITLANHKFCFTVPFFKKPHKEEMLERLWVNDIFLLSKQTTDDLASVQSKSIDILLKGLIDLDDFLTANGIDYMLTGSLGLYMHGLTPNTYLPHDIDIIILDGGIPFLPDDSLLILFEKYCGSSGPIYEDGTRTFIFYIGSYHVEVNAFLHDNALFSPNSYREMLILNHSIKVSDAFCIFKEKYRLRRLKDYQFNIDLQNKLNGYLNQQTNKNEITDSNHGYYTVKDVSLPFPEIPHKEITFIPYPEPKDSVKKKIKSLFLQVVKDPFYSYLAITNSIISEESFIGDKIRPLWVPSEIDKCLKVKIEVKGTNVECTYSQNGVNSSFISKCNSENIDDVVELTYNLLNRLGLIGYFISDISKAINSINYNNWLNDREDDLPF